jgi:hypothetical protein
MELSKAVAGAALLLIVVLAAGHALTQTTSQDEGQKPGAAQSPAKANSSG